MVTQSIATAEKPESENETRVSYDPAKEVGTVLDKLRAEFKQIRNLLSEKTISEIISHEDVFKELANHENELFASERKALVDTFHNIFGEDIPLLENAVIVNMGSGWGIHSRMISDIFKARGIDLEVLPGMAAQTKSKNIQEGVTAINEVVGDAGQTPLANNSVEVVFSHGTIRYIKEPEKMMDVVEEAMRILKPGGVAIMGDVDKPAVELLTSTLKKMEIVYEVTENQVEVFRMMRFVSLCVLYNDNSDFELPGKNILFSQKLVEDFRRQVNEQAQESGSTPIQVMMEMAGTEVKTLMYVDVRKPEK